MFSTLSNWFWDIVAPPFCSWCRNYIEARYPLCNTCLALVKPVVTDTLDISSYTIKIYALGAYQDPLKRLLLSKNYHNPIGSHQLGVLLANHFKLDADMVVPVPSHWTRTAWRGFNHIEIMARVIADSWNISCMSLLTRHKKTEMQSTIVVERRKDNVSNAFEVSDSSLLKDKNILLVDDLMTTGSTVKECVKMLAKHKPKSIAVLVACRAI